VPLKPIFSNLYRVNHFEEHGVNQYVARLNISAVPFSG